MFTKRTIKSRRSVRFIPLLFVGVVGIGLITFAVLGTIDYVKRTQTGITTPSPQQTVKDTPVISEKKPVAITSSYTVPANQPRVITIPGLKQNAYVQRVGIASDGAMATPNNIYFTGWYVNSVAPGDTGVSIINGHAGGRYTQGVFRNLHNLKTDDEISIQMGDLSWRYFAVVSVNTYPVDDAAAALFKDDPSIDKELHLITCDGVFNDRAQSYNERTIVVAKFVR